MRCLDFSFFWRTSLWTIALSAASTATHTSAAHIDTFGSGVNTFEIEFAHVGAPGNPPDTTGEPNPAGSVSYGYRIGKFEISEEMIDKANAQSALYGYPLGIDHDGRGPDKPATSIDWIEAARFINWLNTSTGSAPAYKFDTSGNFQLWEPSDAGYNPSNLYRNSQARYFLPSADEWYKAAFYDPGSGSYFDYPTGSDSIPTPVASGTDPETAIYMQPLEQGPADINNAGGLSRYGTMAQGGNAYEWEETSYDLLNDDTSAAGRGFRGGYWFNSAFLLSSLNRGPASANQSTAWTGFRVASTDVIPEPSMAVLTAQLILGLLGLRRIGSKN